MSDDPKTDPGLSGAYALASPDDCRRLYADWADSYDADFAQGMDYRLPALVARAFVEGGGGAPVLDVGAGTGLLAAALRGLGHEGAIDGIDLSAAMLARAAEKGLYRELIEGDVTRPLPGPPRYRGIVSSGTFTHGHVGPEALEPLLQVALPGAFFCLSVNAGVWDRLGFGPALNALGTAIAGFERHEVAIYGAAARARDPGHADDCALIVRFRKA